MAPINTGAGAMDAFSRRSARLHVDIVLKGQTKGLVPSYTTFDRIEGEVHITADKDTEFDQIQINFEGSSIDCPIISEIHRDV